MDQAPRGSEQPTQGRCGAKLRKSDPPRYCIKYPLAGSTRCDLHNGRAAVGADASRFKHGRWSKALPVALAARYEELVDDREYLNLGHDIGLLDLRLGQLLARLEQGESDLGWAQAREAYGALRIGISTSNSEAIRRAMQSLGQVLQGTAGIDQTWRDIREGLQERRLLVESERRRLVDMHQMVTVEEVLLLVSAIGGVIQRYVQDSAARIRIASEIQQLIGSSRRPGHQVVDAQARRRVPSVSVTPGGSDGR